MLFFKKAKHKSINFMDVTTVIKKMLIYKTFQYIIYV